MNVMAGLLKRKRRGQKRRLDGSIFSASRREGGFTLAEVMVTLVIFAITSMGLALFMVSMIGSNDYANRLTTGVQLAEDKLEELKNECCLVVEPGSDTIGSFTRVWNFIDNDPVPGMLQAVVTVSWHDANGGVDLGQEHSVTLVALMLPP